MRVPCRVIAGLFVLLWVFALLLLVTPGLGWIAPPNQLSALLLLLIGHPWVLMIDSAAWVVVAPLVWPLLILGVCHLIQKYRG